MLLFVFLVLVFALSFARGNRLVVLIGHERLHEQTVMTGLLVGLLCYGLQLHALVVVVAISLEPRLHVLALLLLKPHYCHVFFLGGVLHANIVLVVLQAFLEGGALQDLPLHHDIKLRLLVLCYTQFHSDPLAEGKSHHHQEQEESDMESELPRNALKVLFDDGVIY